ncbi:hypothetical protein HaLaN_07425 [Haematococcus lacustris]|uniref:Uncharacterized protein n=1 Tax=Haematococcus lacustris TaxID=44745 RepID=A0A699YYL6_HAELA|nr:hypothetical protein HaLaN_07425 [Haematococcus lacustris]
MSGCNCLTLVTPLQQNTGREHIARSDKVGRTQGQTQGLNCRSECTPPGRGNIVAEVAAGNFPGSETHARLRRKLLG